jgi:hypothetical protein
MSFFEYDDCFVWRCNGDCGKEVIFKPHDFMGCVAELRSRGWSFHCDDEDRTWTHYCQRCRHKHQSVSIFDRTIGKPREVKGSG